MIGTSEKSPGAKQGLSGQLEQLVLHAHEFAVHVEENMICKNYFFMHLYFAISDPFVFVNGN